MSGLQEMPSLRRRLVPGRASAPPASEPLPQTADQATESTSPSDSGQHRRSSRAGSAGARRGNTEKATPIADDSVPRRLRAADYSTTRLVNFRIPVDLHDRFAKLVQDAGREHLWLRKPSLTELLIAMLEEGPQTTVEVAEMLRRKRAAEYEQR